MAIPLCSFRAQSLIARSYRSISLICDIPKSHKNIYVYINIYTSPKFSSLIPVHHTNPHANYLLFVLQHTPVVQWSKCLSPPVGRSFTLLDTSSRRVPSRPVILPPHKSHNYHGTSQEKRCVPRSTATLASGNVLPSTRHQSAPNATQWSRALPSTLLGR